MSATHDEDIFWNLVDEFIERANEACDTAGDPALVSAALLQACSRFNAFSVASASLDRKEFTEEMPSALEFLTGQFHDQLQADLEDYREHYKVYIARERPDEPLH